MEELVSLLLGSGLLVLCDTFWVLELGALLKTVFIRVRCRNDLYKTPSRSN